MNVPDSVMGRFEMLSLFMVLFFRRTDNAGPAVKQLAQDMVDTFFEDIDHSLRELGVGDVSVPKRMKKLARMFYGRANAYGPAIGEKDQEALTEALMRNIHPPRKKTVTNDHHPDNTDMRALASTIIALDGDMMKVSESDLLDGRLGLSDPVSGSTGGTLDLQRSGADSDYQEDTANS
ncbi:MAG: ubiquinol-cytochrome C chaperone [Alphaproteobacteria bacterium]|nr:ubiquinol-cytochrome C chaperone [Alphaproteobacteria bacterium]